jgi:putative ATPase
MTTPLFPDDPMPQAGTPLAERMRPRSFDEFVGQAQILAPDRPLRQAIERGLLHSLILWGPPGTGKTTIARLLAQVAEGDFVAFSAVMSGIKEIKEVIAAADVRRRQTGRRTVLFVDEIHRFNKAQQDAFLPHVEGGTIILVGATTENPSFEVNSALLSRAKVYVLEPLTTDDVVAILRRALTDSARGLGGSGVDADDETLAAIAVYANGDARVSLNLLEQAVAAIEGPTPDSRRRLDLPQLSGLIERRMLLYDKSGEEHYNLISALHKSIRNSDADAALYWLARMLEAGEDPLYVARRLVRFASEDIGNADPRALDVSLAAKDAVHFLGMPEANTALAQCVVYMAAAPKSNAVYVAYGAAARDALKDVASPVPLHLRNAPTKLMKGLGYGREYKYAHDEAEGVAEMSALPPHLEGRRYYQPTDRGVEARLRDALERARALRQGTRKPPG